jgi:hypothetical protein
MIKRSPARRLGIGLVLRIERVVQFPSGQRECWSAGRASLFRDGLDDGQCLRPVDVRMLMHARTCFTAVPPRKTPDRSTTRIARGSPAAWRAATAVSEIYKPGACG